ncbi:MAG: LysM peptidoglycan-binding domain-containing protein, partial [Bdellovibrionales bacterium]
AFTDQKPRIYSVNRGDTLWDVSKILFADPLFWPKIWSFNTDSILNPHEIQPGWKLQFLPGTLDQPPALVVVEVEGQKLPSAQKEFPPLNPIPPSLPEYTFNLPFNEKVKFKRLDKSASSRPLVLPLPVEILDVKPERVGEVVEFDEGATMASESRDIYVRLNSGLSIGKYSIIKSVKKSRNGFIVVYGGEIDVTEKINDSDNIFRAQVSKLINPMELGDDLITGTIPDVNIDESPLSIEAPLIRIVGGYRSPTDSIFAAHSFVFLDAGSELGLVEGESINIYQNPKIRISKTKMKKAYRLVGQLKLLRVSKRASTAYILNANTEIIEGDFAG